MKNKWFVVPYEIMGVKLWAVEDLSGYINRYCTSKELADQLASELNI